MMNVDLQCLPSWRLAALDRLAQGKMTPAEAELWAKPEMILERNNMTPDPWQTKLLRSTSARILMVCSRQAGKSTAVAALVWKTAILQPNSLILLLSPTLRQSGELYRAKVVPLLKGIGNMVTVTRETQLTLELSNGSRIISLPDSEAGCRGFSSVTLMVVDEASRVSDGLYHSMRPMMAVSKGRLVCLSTPYGKQGWFYESWQGKLPWERIRITADQVSRISPEFLEEERKTLPERWFKMEYECVFTDTVDCAFRPEDIEAAMDPTLEPLTF